MLDHYSYFSMPSLKERKESLMEYAKNNNLVVSEEIIFNIVLNTAEYSMSGYAMFGKQEEITKLNNHFKKNTKI